MNVRTHRRAAAGFTLIELLIATSVAGVLSSIAYPSFEGQVHKARRSDALVGTMQVQMAQERWRANSPSYGTLAEIGLPTRTPGGHYTLSVSDAGSDGYQLVATATGTQSRDARCRQLRLRLDGANVVHSSGPDSGTDNAADLNRRCWNL